MNLRTSSFLACLVRATVLSAVAFLVISPLFAAPVKQDAAWGRLITSAAIACNPATHKVYAVNEGAGSITVLNSATGAVHIVAVGSQPIALGINRSTNRIYVANSGSESVSVIDGNSDRVIATVPSAPLSYTLAVDEVSNKIYVTHTYSGTVTEIDGASNRARELHVGGADSIAIDPQTATVFLSTYEDPEVRLLSEATGTVTKAAVGPHVWGFLFDQPSATLFLAHTATDEVVALDEQTHQARTIAVGKMPCALAIAPMMRRLYVVNYGDETLSVIDLKSRNVIATLPLGHHPQSIAVDFKTNRIYVANVHGDSVTVIDGTRNEVIGTRSAGRNPYGVAVDAASGHVYAANYAAPWVTPVSTSK